MKRFKAFFLVFIFLPFVSVFGLALTSVHAENDTSITLESDFEDLYMINEKIRIPKGKIKYQGKEYAASSYVTYPSGHVARTSEITLSEHGQYTVHYSANISDKVIRKKVTFKVTQKLYDIVGNKSTLNFGKHEYMGEEVGIILGLAENETFIFNKPIDISSFIEANKLLSFKVIPATIGIADAMKITVTLTDIYDSENYIKIDIKKCDDNLERWAEVQTYVTGRAANQDATGLEALTTGNTIVYEGKVFRFHKNNPYGACISFSMAGSPLFESKNNPNYDPAHLKNQRVDLAMNYDAGKIFAGSNTTFVTDLKSEAIYGNNLWEGFTTGEVYLSIQASNYNAERCNLFITKIGDIDVAEFTENLYVDDLPPTITVDLKGYDESALPVGRINKIFKIFAASAFDDFDKDVDVDVEVYLNRGLENECRINVVDGSFVPKYNATYEIIYSAKDSSGNTAIKTIRIAFSETGKALAIDEDIAGDEVGYVGEATRVKRFVYKNNHGEISESIKAIHIETGKEYQVVDYSFTPLETGSYKIIYEYSDFFYKNEQSYELEVLSNERPTIIGEIILPKYLVKDNPFPLPAINAYEFSTGKPKALATEIYVSEDGMNFEKLDGNVYLPKANSFATIRYSATFNNQQTHRDFNVKVVDVGFGSTLLIGKYMYTDDFFFTQHQQYVEYVSKKQGTASMEFIRPLQADDFSLRLSASEGKQNFNKINIHLTDVTNEANRLKFTYEKMSGGKVRFNVNDGEDYIYEAAFADTNNPLIFAYNNWLNQVSPIPNKYINLSSFFSGFESRFVYLTIELEGITDESAVKVFNINGQPICDIAGDIIDPKICATPDLGEKEFGTIYTIKGVTISDVLDQNLIEYMIVTDPDREVVTSIDGTVLDETADYTRNYEIKLDKYGDYIVYYKAIDSNDNEAIYSYVIRVSDSISPNVRILNPETSGKTKTPIPIASLAISDNSSDSFTIYACVKVPSGRIYSLVTVDSTVIISKSFTPETPGKYEIYYYVADESGNTTIVSYVVNVS